VRAIAGGSTVADLDRTPAGGKIPVNKESGQDRDKQAEQEIFLGENVK
jgi:hypothetical protein